MTYNPTLHITYDDTYRNPMQTVWYNDDYSSLTTGVSTYYPKPNFSGAVITYYQDGRDIGYEEIDFNEKNQENLQKIRDDLIKLCKERAKKAVYRLTDVSLLEGAIVRDTVNDKGEPCITDCTEDVINELKNGVKRTVYLRTDVADFLSKQDPLVFDGWTVVLIDREIEQDITKLPKDIDGFKDEATDEYVARIKEKTNEVLRAERCAVQNAEVDINLQRTIINTSMGS